MQSHSVSGPNAAAIRTASVPAVVALVLLLALQLAFTLVPLRALDPAWDEVAHVGAAHYLAREGRDALNPEHPTLAKRLAALGMALAVPHATLPEHRGVDQWTRGAELL